jgi:hypothetical protein
MIQDLNERLAKSLKFNKLILFFSLSSLIIGLFIFMIIPKYWGFGLGLIINGANLTIVNLIGVIIYKKQKSRLNKLTLDNDKLKEMAEENAKVFYNVIHCRVCHNTVKECQCSPIPCPFCDMEFGFTQDWNIHLQANHNKEIIEALKNV